MADSATAVGRSHHQALILSVYQAKETARRVRDGQHHKKTNSNSLEDLRSHLVDHSTIRSPRLFLPGGRLEVVDQPSYPPFAAEEVQRNNEPSSPLME